MERFVKHLAICFGLCFAIMLIVILASSARIGFWPWIAFLFSGSVFIGIGSYLGSLFLQFVRPDTYLTSGAFDSFKKKIFWSIGPQLIGGFIGYMGCNGFLINVLGLTQFR